MWCTVTPKTSAAVVQQRLHLPSRTTRVDWKGHSSRHPSCASFPCKTKIPAGHDPRRNCQTNPPRLVPCCCYCYCCCHWIWTWWWIDDDGWHKKNSSAGYEYLFCEARRSCSCKDAKCNKVALLFPLFSPFSHLFCVTVCIEVVSRHHAKQREEGQAAIVMVMALVQQRGQSFTMTKKVVGEKVQISSLKK